MQDRLHKETNKMEIAERRRKLDLDGYSADLQQMRKKIDFYTKYILKLKKLVNEDQVEDMDISDYDENEEERKDNDYRNDDQN